MYDSEIAYWLRALNNAKETGVMQRFSDGSEITVVDLVRSRLLSMGLRLEYDEHKEIYFVVAFTG